MNFPFSASQLLTRFSSVSIKTRMAIMVATLVLLATIAVSLASLFFVRESLNDIIRDQVSNLLVRTADEIDQNLAARKASLASLAVGVSKIPANDAVALQHYLDQNTSAATMFNALLVLNERGAILAKVGDVPALGGSFEDVRQSIDASVAAQRATFSSPHRGDANHLAMATMTDPVFDAQGVIRFVVIGLIDFRDDQFLQQLASLKIGKSGYFCIVNTDGLILLHPDKSRILQNATDILSGTSTAVSGLMRAAHADPVLLDQDRLLFSKPLEITDWTLWAIYPQDEVLAPVAGVESRAALAAILVALLMGTIAWLITRNQIMPLQRLRERIERAQEFPTQLTAPGSFRQDEIGMLENAFDQLVRERLYAEAQFRSMEAELHASIDSSLDAFLIFKPDRNADGDIADFRFSYLNAKAAILFGMTQEELLKSKLTEVLPAVRANGWFDQLVSVITSQRSLEDELELMPSIIRATWLHYQMVPLAEGAAVTMRDISERKSDEVEMREKRAFLQSLIEYLPVLIFAKSFKGEAADTLIVWNKTAEHVMGYSAEQVIGKSNRDIFPSKVADTLNALDRQMLADPRVVVIPEFPYRRPDGALRYLHSISVPLFGETGKVDYILGIVEDITVRRSQEWTLKNQKAEMEAINDALPLGLFRTDREGGVTYINSAFERMTGFDLDEAKHHGWFRAVHPEDRQKAQEGWLEAIHNDLPYQSTHRFQHRDGRVLWISLKAAQIRLDGQGSGYVGSIDDITARRMAEQAVLKGERWLRTITDHVPALIAYIDMDERYRFSNVHYDQLFNTRDTSLLGRRVCDVIGSENYSYTADRIAAVLQGEKVSFERENLDADGQRKYWRVDYIPDVQDGKVAGFYSMLLDITESKQVENQLRTLARTDSLTGLANRSYFSEKLAEAITLSESDKSLLAVLFLDIDEFKAFNDSFGHHGGDLVLREFSLRLSACIRHSDTVARLAGDEFVILLQGMHSSDEMEIIAKKIMMEMERDFDVLGNACRVTTSIGITIRRSGETDIETLLRRADDALYTAKSAGRNRFKIIW